MIQFHQLDGVSWSSIKGLRVTWRRLLNPGCVVLEQTFYVHSENFRGNILPITSQCTIKMIPKGVFFFFEAVTVTSCCFNIKRERINRWEIQTLLDDIWRLETHNGMRSLLKFGEKCHGILASSGEHTHTCIILDNNTQTTDKWPECTCACWCILTMNCTYVHRWKFNQTSLWVKVSPGDLYLCNFIL